MRSLTRAAAASPKPRVLDGVELTARATGDSAVVTPADEDPLVPQRLSSPQLSTLARRPPGRPGPGRLFICHAPAVVRHFADRVVEMRDGRVSSSRPLR